MPSAYGSRLTTFEDSERESEYGYVRKVRPFPSPVPSLLLPDGIPSGSKFLHLKYPFWVGGDVGRLVLDLVGVFVILRSLLVSYLFSMSDCAVRSRLFNLFSWL